MQRLQDIEASWGQRIRADLHIPSPHNAILSGRDEHSVEVCESDSIDLLAEACQALHWLVALLGWVL